MMGTVKNIWGPGASADKIVPLFRLPPIPNMNSRLLAMCKREHQKMSIVTMRTLNLVSGGLFTLWMILFLFINVLAIVGVCKWRKRDKKPQQLMICSLLITGLGLACFVIPIELTVFYQGSFYTSTSANILSQITLAVNQVYTVRGHPDHLLARRTPLILGGVWLISMLSSVQAVFSGVESNANNVKMCGFANWVSPSTREIITIIHIVLILVSALFIFMCNLYAFRFSTARGRNAHDSDLADRRKYILLCITVFVFAVCMFPFRVVGLVSILTGLRIGGLGMLVLKLVAFTQGWLNPLFMWIFLPIPVLECFKPCMLVERIELRF